MTDVIAAPAAIATDDGATLSRLKRMYSDFVSSKTNERDEAKEARRYYHAAHWTSYEIKKLQERGQPVITYNRIGRKIDGVVGLIERPCQDPKAFPRTPQHEQGADLATAVLNYALDVNDWRSLSPDVAHKGAVDGIGGLEIGLDQSPNGDVEITLAEVDPEDFFYDPRSVKPDFSDARYLGVAKWIDQEAAAEMFPEMEDTIRERLGGDGSGGESTWDEKEIRWTNVREKRIRVVEHWYKSRGEWSYTFYSGDLELDSGPSPFVDDKGSTFCRFIMFSNGVDHDGDRYGFVRNLRGPQDEINQRRSKGLHLFNSRRIITEEGALDNVEKTRQEAAKADGVIVTNPGYRFEFDDAARHADAQGNLAMLTEAKGELENFGPNPALIGQGTGVAGSSGRAIALLQQAGIAELGPFILRYRGWKLRVYRAVFHAIQKFWTSERYIRVTDSEDLAQFVKINGLENGPLGPQLVNAVGSLDVDIILDEGPDQVNSMADAYDTLIALSSRGATVPPDIIIELSSLPGNVKKRVLEKLAQAQAPNPMAEMAGQLELQGKQVDNRATAAKAQKDEIDAVLKAQEARAAEQLLAGQPFSGLEPLGPVEQGLI